jgi:hypothetical protein
MTWRSPADLDLGIVATVGTVVRIDGDTPVFVEPTDGPRHHVLVISPASSADSRHLAASAGVDAELWIEVQPHAVLDRLVAKAAANMAGVPGLNLLGRGRLHGRDRQSRDESLRGLPRSPLLAGALAGVAGGLLAAAATMPRRSGSPKVSVAYITDVELQLLERLQTWRLVQGRARMDDFWSALNQHRLAFQLVVSHLMNVDGGLSDVEGMTGIHMASSVATTSRFLMESLAQAVAAARGHVRTSEAGILEWAEESDPRVFDDCVRGLFPVPQDIDRHVRWLRRTIDAYRRELARHWLLRLLQPASAKWVPADLTPTARRNIPDAQCEVRPPPASSAEFDRMLRTYSTSIADLLRRFPVPADASVYVTGSLADGRGHARSDIDLIVVSGSAPPAGFDIVSATAGHYEFQVGTTPNRNLICVEFMTDPLLATLRAWQAQGTDALRTLTTAEASPYARLAAEERLRSLNNLDRLASYFHRAMMSLPLREGDAGARWRSVLSVDDFTAAVVSSHLLEFGARMRHAMGAQRTHELAAVARARYAWEELLLAYLASQGSVIWRRRWIVHALAQLGDVALAETAKRGLLPRVSDAGSYIDWIQSQSVAVMARIAARYPLVHRIIGLEQMSRWGARDGTRRRETPAVQYTRRDQLLHDDQR